MEDWNNVTTRVTRNRDVARFMKDKHIDIYGTIRLEPEEVTNSLVKAKGKTRWGGWGNYLILPRALDLAGLNFNVGLDTEAGKAVIDIQERTYHLNAQVRKVYKKKFLFRKAGYRRTKRKLFQQYKLQPRTLKMDINVNDAFVNHQQVEYQVKNRLMQQIDEDIEAIMNGRADEQGKTWTFHLSPQYRYVKELHVQQVEVEEA
jgi:hypothetical protein